MLALRIVGERTVITRELPEKAPQPSASPNPLPAER
jgi:hypothetical protein